jgi:maltose alpha-D-glucosyltransferase/alpha-amylase
VFGLGSYEPIEPSNSKIFAHLREYEDDVMLCVHNLARSAQAVELDLSAYKGRVPVEVFGRSQFPPVGDLPYLLTLAPRGFYWFQLTATESDD